MAAAAAVAIAAVIAGAVALTNRPHTSTFDTVAAPVGGATSSTAAPSAAAGRSNSEDVAPSTTTSSSAQSSTADTLPDLGAVASEEALGAEVKQQDPALMATSESTSAPTTTAVSAPAPSTTSTVSSLSPLHSPIPATTCDAAVRAATPGLGTLVYAATAMYQGIRVEVLVYQAGEPSTYRLIGARTDTCAVLVDRAL